MTLKIDLEKFKRAHRAFQEYMLKRSGVPFSSFEHPFLVDTEIAYKWKVYQEAKNALNLPKWESWKRQSGRILQSVRNACHPKISANILEHRYGLQHSSEAALYKVKDEEISTLESKLYYFFLGGMDTPQEFGQRFDVLADYLRENSLGCNWAFMSYLAFLLSPQQYFPIRPSRFDALLAYYGVEQKISGSVSWRRYTTLLELAEILKQKLSLYGIPNAIEIQSYMWVVSYLLRTETANRFNDVDDAYIPDFEAELKLRMKQAEERERIGLLGEKFIYEQETLKLQKAGRNDLAKLVKIVSFVDNYSYDIRSFDLDGTEIHIEVKTTTRSPKNDDGFWLSEKERIQAEVDEQWVVYRVWNINTVPTYQNLGNIVLNPHPNWRLQAASWYVKRQTG